MEKRLLAALMLSFLFLFAWTALAPRLFPELAKTDDVVEESADPDAPETETARAVEQSPIEVAPPVGTPTRGPSGDPVTPVAERASETSVIGEESVRVKGVSSPTFRATFSNKGGALKSFRLLEENDLDTGEPIELVWQGDSEGRPFPFGIRSDDEALQQFANGAIYQLTEQREGSNRSLEMVAADGTGRQVRKTFTFDEGPTFGYRVEVSGARAPWRLVLGPGMGATGSANDDRFALSGNVILKSDGDHEMLKRGKEDELETWEDVTYAGLVDHYFIKALLPSSSGQAVTEPVKLPIFDQDGNEEMVEELVVSLQSSGDVLEGRALFGPKRRDLVNQYGLEDALDFGFLGPIAVLLLGALGWIYQYTGNYGWAIILLTVVIKVLFFPLQHKSMTSMKRMQRVQPKMNAIKDKYKKSKTDPVQRQKMNEDMMKLYKTEGINPASGCLPMLLQLPILWAFYMSLSHAIELRGEPWIGWIADLSAKDPYYILPIVMTGTMFLQQLITPSTGDPMQRKIFLAMPLIFGFIFKEFPAGLVLYWMVQNILTIVQQAFLNNWWKNHPESLGGDGAKKPPKKAVVV